MEKLLLLFREKTKEFKQGHEGDGSENGTKMPAKWRLLLLLVVLRSI